MSAGRARQRDRRCTRRRLRGFLWSPPDRDLDRWRTLYDAAARAAGGEPNAGRYLLAWAEEVGFSHVQASASVWLFHTAKDRAWWWRSWAERALQSGYAHTVLEAGLATVEELTAISDAWQRWSEAPTGWLVIPHGEVIARR